MNIITFTNELEDILGDMLDEIMPGTLIRKQEIDKLQGESYTALVVTPPDSIASINLNVNDIYRRYSSKMVLEAAAESVEIIKRGLKEIPNIDPDILTDYDFVKHNLIVQVVATEKNKDMLSRIPHKNIEDLAIVYRIRVSTGRSSQTCLVTDMMMENYKISEEQLFRDAMESAQKLCPPVIRDLGSVMMELAVEGGIDIEKDMLERSELFNTGIYYVGTKVNTLGGAAMFYPGMMERCAGMFGGSFYIMPSSVHEMLVASERYIDSADKVNSMVREVNVNCVAAAERLTDHGYFYNAAEKRLYSV